MLGTYQVEIRKGAESHQHSGPSYDCFMQSDYYCTSDGSFRRENCFLSIIIISIYLEGVDHHLNRNKPKRHCYLLF